MKAYREPLSLSKVSEEYSICLSIPVFLNHWLEADWKNGFVANMVWDLRTMLSVNYVLSCSQRSDRCVTNLGIRASSSSGSLMAMENRSMRWGCWDTHQCHGGLTWRLLLRASTSWHLWLAPCSARESPRQRSTDAWAGGHWHTRDGKYQGDMAEHQQSLWQWAKAKRSQFPWILITSSSVSTVFPKFEGSQVAFSFCLWFPSETNIALGKCIHGKNHFSPCLSL